MASRSQSLKATGTERSNNFFILDQETSMDRQSAVELTAHRLQTKVGHTEKNRHRTLNVAVVMSHLIQVRSTVDFKTDSDEERALGCKSIWHRIAYDMALDENARIIERPRISMYERFDSARRHWQLVRSAVKACRKHLIDDHQIALFVVPRFVGQKAIQVITLDPDYVVNDAAKTASDIALECGDRRLRANIKSIVEQYHRMTGSRENVVAKIHELAEEHKRSNLPQGLFHFQTEPVAVNGESPPTA
jgi:hypothetical protein